jgi:hypothetical protein
MLLLAGIVVEMELIHESMMVHLVHDTSQQQYRWKIPEVLNTVMCS